MSFFFSNIKKFFFLFCAIFAVIICGIQSANYYKKYKTLKTDAEIAFINTDSRSVLKKSYKTKASVIAENGTPIYSGDSVITFSHPARIEIPQLKKRVQVLPNSELVLLYNGKKFEIFLDRGDLNFINDRGEDTGASHTVFVYKRNKEGDDYVDYDPAAALGSKNSQLSVTKINQVYVNGKPQFNVQWKSVPMHEDYWVELWAGPSKDNLSLVKAYPFEKTSLSEVIHSSQFYWQLKLTSKQVSVEETQVSFWKPSFQQQIVPIFPGNEALINAIADVSPVDLKWTKAQDIKDVKVEIALDDKFQAMAQDFQLSTQTNVTFKPKSYGKFFWRISSVDGNSQGPVQSFYFAPMVSADQQLLSWSEHCDERQFYYEQPVLYLKWKSNYDYPVNKYKVTLQYYQKPLGGNSDFIRQENIFTENDELYFKVNSSSMIRVNVQAYNSKMEAIGDNLERTFELTARSPRRLLTLSTHEKTPKNDYISDRQYSLNFDANSVSSLYRQNYTILNKAGESVRRGSFVKGQNLDFRGLPVGYYSVQVDFVLVNTDKYLVSQYWPGDTRSPASLQRLKQEIKVKLVPSIDFNIDRNSLKANGEPAGISIKPEVSDVEIRN